MKKYMKIAMLALGIVVCVCLSTIGLIGMLCNYQSVVGLPWAVLAGATFIGAVSLSIELGELKTK